jgi:hypothetical protein
MTRLQHYLHLTAESDINVFYFRRLTNLARIRKMGQQGNYSGNASGAINQHKHLAMRGETAGGGNVQADEGNMPRGHGSGDVSDPNLPKGSGTPETSEHRSGDVRAINPSE